MANRASYRIDVYNTSGTKLSEIVDFLSLSYVKKRNAPGECVFELDGSHLQLSNFSDNCYIQV